jgi:hypothetical protein
MSDVYEYRRAPGKGAIWLACIALIMLLAAVFLNDADQLMWLVWVFGAVTFTWMLIPKPVAGIRVDNEQLVLSAWRNPRHFMLDDIAHLKITEASFETTVSIVFKNGEEEPIFAGDLPDFDTLISVMAKRGIPVRDIA